MIIKKFKLFKEDLQNGIVDDTIIQQADHSDIIEQETEQETDIDSLAFKIFDLSDKLDSFDSQGHDVDDLRIVDEMKKLTAHLKGLVDELNNESGDSMVNNITNESWFKKDRQPSDEKLGEINSKISDASYSIKTFGTMTKQGAFMNGAKWAIHNLTDDEIKYIRENGNKDDFSFFGIS